MAAKDEVMPEEIKLSPAVRDIVAERQRQISAEGYLHFRDDAYAEGELAIAAACYASCAGQHSANTTMWPWGPETWKPSTDRRRDLVKAGALILAELERLDRIGSITPLDVVRDEHGFWTHPAWPTTDEELIPFAWFTGQGLEVREKSFEYDAPEELQADWYCNGLADCTGWDPSKPDGEGWFIFSIHDADDGPVCVWVRRVVTP